MTRQDKPFSLADSVERKILGRIPWEILGLTIVFGAAVAVFFDAVAGLLFLAGGIFTALNYLWLKQEVTKALQKKSPKAVPSLLAFYGIRLILILGIFFIIIFFFSKKIFAFIAGFSTIIPVFLVEGAIGLLNLKKWKN